jgi:hypothetical protein
MQKRQSMLSASGTSRSAPKSRRRPIEVGRVEAERLLFGHLEDVVLRVANTQDFGRQAARESVFEKCVCHGQRLISVAVAAMMMRVSATAVSCS